MTATGELRRLTLLSLRRITRQVDCNAPAVLLVTEMRILFPRLLELAWRTERARTGADPTFPTRYRQKSRAGSGGESDGGGMTTNYENDDGDYVTKWETEWEVKDYVDRKKELEAEREEIFLKDRGRTNKHNILVKENRELRAENERLRAEKRTMTEMAKEGE